MNQKILTLLITVAAVFAVAQTPSPGGGTLQRVTPTTSAIARQVLTNETGAAMLAAMGGSAGPGPGPTNGPFVPFVNGTIPVAIAATNPANSFVGSAAGLNQLNVTSGLDVTSSNWLGGADSRPPSVLYGYDPIGNADAKGTITVLQFGDSTSEYAESPVQQTTRKIVRRYGFGGWVSDGYAPGTKLTSETGGPWQFNGLYGTGYIYATPTAGVVSSNNVPGTVWGMAWSGIPAGESITWTNDFVNGVATPDGGLPGATRCCVWYTATNGLGTFQIAISTNGGAFATVASVNSGSQGPGNAQVVNSWPVVLSSGPTTNHFAMKVVGISGTTIINMVGMWNEYAGATIVKFNQGGWPLTRLFYPNYTSGLWNQPTVANQASLNNFLQALPRVDLTLASTVILGPDNGQSTLDPAATHTNFDAAITYLSSEFNAYSPSNLTVWVTMAPGRTNLGFWPYEPKVLRDLFVNPANFTGHDYVEFSGENTSAERWGYTFGTHGDVPFANWPHWSWSGGQYVANDIWLKLLAYSNPSTFNGSVNGASVKSQSTTAYGIDVSNDATATVFSQNGGFSLSVGGDIGHALGATPTRTAGVEKQAMLGYVSAGSSTPDATWLMIHSSLQPLSTFAFAGAAPWGQGNGFTNLFTFRNKGTDIWSIGGAGLPDGSANGTEMSASGGNIIMHGSSGTINASNLTSTASLNTITLGTNAHVTGALQVDGGITENTPGGWLSTNLPDGTLFMTNIITGAWRAISTTGNVTNSGTLYGSGSGLSNGIVPGLISKMMPVPIMFFSSFVDIWDGSQAFPSQVWVSNSITELKQYNLTGIGMTNIVLEDAQYAINTRNPSDNGLQANPTNFPQGFPFTTQYAHTNGFNIGSYIERNNPSCLGLTPASFSSQLIWQDTLSNLVWGFDGMIFDECGVSNATTTGVDNGNGISTLNQAIRIFNETVFDAAADDVARITARRGMWLIKTQGSNTRNVVPWESMYGVNVVGVPAAGPAAIPLVTVSDFLSSIKVCTTNWNFFVGPGHFLDPTSFQLGLPLPTIREYLSYYSMLPACLQIGKFALVPDFYNAEWKQVWQDPLVNPTYNIYSNSLVEAWLKPCVGGKYGILFFNLNNSPQTITLNSSHLGVSPNSGFTLRDIWNFTNMTTFAAGNGFSFTVPATNCVMEVLLPLNPQAPFTGSSPPPAQCYPPGGTVFWTSNNPAVYYGIKNTYLLQNNSSGNGWDAQTLLANTSGASFTPNRNLTNAVVILDPSSLGMSNNTMMTTIPDMSSNRYNFIHGNYAMPFFTNSPTVINGKSYLNFLGNVGSGRITFGAETNIATLPTGSMSVFAVCNVPNAAGVMFSDNGTGNFAVFPSGGSIFAKLGGSQFSGVYSLNTNTFAVLEFYLNGGSSYINTNNITCATGTLGTTPCSGLQIGFGTGGVQNIPFGLAWYGVYTNMTQTDRTNLGSWLVSWMNNTNTTVAH